MSNSPLFELETHLDSVFPFEKWQHVRSLVAVSGGPDSVATLRAMVESGKRSPTWNGSQLVVGHINHRTRDGESDGDASFVVELAQELGLECQIANRDEQLDLGNSEESMRDFRYERLVEMAEQVGARYLVMGHNRDDQIETILFRIFRGTGVAGLAGIPPHRRLNESLSIIRPLLGVSRQEIECFLKSTKQTFRTDATNSDTVYTRNFLRNELVPKLKARFGEAMPDGIARLGKQAIEIQDYLNEQSSALDPAIIHESSDCFELNTTSLHPHPPLLIRNWLIQIWIRKNWPRKAMTHAWWSRICDAMLSDLDQVLNLPCRIRFEKTQQTVTFSNP